MLTLFLLVEGANKNVFFFLILKRSVGREEIVDVSE